MPVSFREFSYTNNDNCILEWPLILRNDSNCCLAIFRIYIPRVHSCTVLCDYLFSVIDWCSCDKWCCNLVWFICEVLDTRLVKSDYESNFTWSWTRPVFLFLSFVPRPSPTSSFDSLQSLIPQSPGYNSLISNHYHPQYLPIQKYQGEQSGIG